MDYAGDIDAAVGNFGRHEELIRAVTESVMKTEIANEKATSTGTSLFQLITV